MKLGGTVVTAPRHIKLRLQSVSASKCRPGSVRTIASVALWYSASTHWWQQISGFKLTVIGDHIVAGEADVIPDQLGKLPRVLLFPTSPWACKTSQAKAAEIEQDGETNLAKYIAEVNHP